MEDEYYTDDEQMAPEMAKKKWSEGSLYILDYGDGKQFKIGITAGNPTARANQIKRNAGTLLPNPLDSKLVIHLEMDTNPYYLEQLLHMQHEYYHAGGEWFKFEMDNLTALVSQIKPFGRLTYHDRWYELNKDSLGYIFAGTYPSDINYRKGLDLYAWPSRFHASSQTKGLDDEVFTSLAEEFHQLKADNPGRFDEINLVTFPQTDAAFAEWLEDMAKNAINN